MDGLDELAYYWLDLHREKNDKMSSQIRMSQ